MKRRLTASFVLLVVILLTASLVPVAAVQPEARALIKIEVRAPRDLVAVETAGVPVYARLAAGKGSYLLAGADPRQIEALQAAGLEVTVLDPDLRGASYYLAYLMPGRPIPDWNAYGRLLLDDGVQALLRTTARQAGWLAEAGIELAAVTFDPKPLRPAPVTSAFPEVVEPDPLIQQMIDQVNQGLVYNYTGGLSGEWPVSIGGSPYTITTRHTYSGTPIQKATQYVGEHLAGLGLAVEYHQWGGVTYPNVIGTITGTLNPDDIFIIGAHLDDMPSSGPAPGADDNASGSVATLIAADILSQYEWGCTLRFAFWTGEEQGLNGSHAYAQRAYSRGENILGYLNLDMIAWNSGGSSPDIDLHAKASLPPTLVLAQLFADVVDAYDLNLIPQINPNGTGASDHASFWQYGYTAILGIEDMGDFNPYYHTSSDDMDNFQDWPYYVEFVKAALGTFAHMTGCLIPGGIGYLDGHVTAASGGAPIADATVTAEDDAGHTFPATTDPSGYYTRTLLAGTYTVTAEAYGYLPATVSGVVITTDTVTTLDFALQTAPTYIVSGTVTEQGSGTPLFAEVRFQGSPVVVWTDPATGFYQATLPQGSYTMQVSAYGHRSQERAIVVDHNQTQDFALEPLPCILLVDDDNNAPDTRPYFTAALDNLGYDYDIFDVGGGSGNGPDLAGLQGYSIVIWFSGDKYSGSAGPNAADEANLAAYLDGGGRLFLSSQDYLYDFGLTTFGQNYLGIGSFTNDSGNASTKYGVPGDPIGGGLGPYPLTYPSGFTDYGDIVNAGTGASVAFRSQANGGNNLDVDKAGGSWKTVFFGTDWVPIYYNNAANGRQVLQQIIDWFGGCACTPPSDASFTWTPPAPIAGQGVTFSGTVTGTAPFLFQWDFGDGGSGTGSSVVHTFAAAGDYTVTMTATNACGSDAVNNLVTVLPAPCEPVQILNVLTTTAGCVVTFTADLAGDPPFVYDWDLGPFGSSADPAPVVDFGLSGSYPYTLTVTNCDGASSDTFGGQVTVECLVCEPVADADLSWTPITPTVGQETIFTGTATGTLPISFTWDFGDGNSATGEVVSHTYDAAATYTVVMTAANCDGAWMTATHSVVVIEGPVVCTEVTGVELSLVTTGTLHPGDEELFRADLAPLDLTTPYSYGLTVNGVPGGVEFSSANPLTFTLVAGEPGTYTVEIAVWNCAMTVPVTDSVSVVVSKPVTPRFYIYLPVIVKE